MGVQGEEEKKKEKKGGGSGWAAGWKMGGERVWGVNGRKKLQRAERMEREAAMGGRPPLSSESGSSL